MSQCPAVGDHLHPGPHFVSEESNAQSLVAVIQAVRGQSESLNSRGQGEVESDHWGVRGCDVSGGGVARNPGRRYTPNYQIIGRGLHRWENLKVGSPSWVS